MLMSPCLPQDDDGGNHFELGGVSLLLAVLQVSGHADKRSHGVVAQVHVLEICS